MEKDPSGLDPNTAGAKLDTGKAPVFRGVIQYFPKGIKQVALLSQFGAEKYSWHGWSAVDDCINRYTDAMLRHLVDETEGPLDDGPGGSGLLHATAVAWNALARLEKIIEEQQNERTRERDNQEAADGVPGSTRGNVVVRVEKPMPSPASDLSIRCDAINQDGC